MRKNKIKVRSKVDRELFKIANWRWQFLRRNEEFQKAQPSALKHCLDFSENGEAAEVYERFVHKWWVSPFQSFSDKDFNILENLESPLLGRVIVESIIENRKIEKRPLRILVSIPFSIPRHLVLSQLKEIVWDKTLMLGEPLLSDGKESTSWIYKLLPGTKAKQVPIRAWGVDEKEKRPATDEYPLYIRVWDLKKNGETFSEIVRIIFGTKIRSAPESLERMAKRYHAKAKSLINGGYKTIAT